MPLGLQVFTVGSIISEAIADVVLSEIVPTDEEVKRQATAIDSLKNALERYAINHGFPFHSIEPQGSTGKKQTQLRGASDIDLFVILSQEDYPEIIGQSPKRRGKAVDSLMENMVDNWFKPALSGVEASSIQKTYSQHPYLSLEMMGFEVDIVSCFLIPQKDLEKDGPITAMDRTIHHSEYVSSNIESLRDDTRILKSFVRACHTYADRCAVGQMGFTGYALELLVILKGGVDEAIRAILELETVPVDPFQRSLEVLRKMPAFRDDSIFIMDPTDPGRNVASSFDKRSFRLLKVLSSQLIAAAREGNFSKIKELLIEKPIPTIAVPKWFESHSSVREFKSDGSVHYTILRDKIHSFARKAANELSRENTGEPRFGEILTEVYFEESSYAVGFIIENPIISEKYERKGPPTSLKEASDSFRHAHPKAFERDGHYWIEESRKWTSAEDHIDSLTESVSINALILTSKTETSSKLLNIMKDWVLIAEPDFPSLK
jgi:tRNA nucleotidyltransferase (CCA-adding enzyme)